MAINTCQAKTLTTEERVSKIEVSLQKQLDKVNNSKQDSRIKDVRATYLAKIAKNKIEFTEKQDALKAEMKQKIKEVKATIRAEKGQKKAEQKKLKAEQKAAQKKSK
jgi:hypothetical protein